MASSSLTELTPDTRERAEAFLGEAARRGYEVSVVSTHRTCADQGTSTAPIIIDGMPIKRAPGCRSWHVWRRAFDIALKDPSQNRYAELGALGKSFGLEWGGDFKTNFDPIHFQYRGGLSLDAICPADSDCASMVARGEIGGPGVFPGPLPGVTVASAGLGAGAFLAGAALGWWAIANRRRR